MSDDLDHRGRPRVAVTGVGLHTPAGAGLDGQLGRRCSPAGRRRARSPRSTRARSRSRSRARSATSIPSPYLGPKESRRVDRGAQLGFAAAVDALADAGDPGADPARCAVVAGTGIGGLIDARAAARDLPDQGSRPRQPVLRADDDAELDRGADRHPPRVERSDAVHLHRVRGQRQRHRRGDAADPRRDRRRRASPAAPRRRSSRRPSPRSPAWVR